MFGVDEAGRGPVLGSLFVACVGSPDLELLPDGITDSKRLSPSRITALATALQETDSPLRYTVVEVPVERIDAEETTMTTVTIEAFARAICAVAQPDEQGVLDACHPKEETFNQLVGDAIAAEGTVTVRTTAEHGADEAHQLVGAASILAKHAREEHVAALADEYGAIGSGYPSDPTTRSFLEEYVQTHGRLPDCARRSWKTSADVLASVEQTTLAAGSSDPES